MKSETRNRNPLKKVSTSLLALLLTVMIPLGVLTSCDITDVSPGDQIVTGEKGDPGKDGRGILKMEIQDGWLVVVYTDDPENPVKIGMVDSNRAYEGTEGLAFYPLTDGTYGVIGERTQYLDKIILPSTYNGKAVTSILPHAFSDSENLAEIIIPDSITSIGEYAFARCESLEQITLPESIVDIQDHAFTRCVKLNQFHIPESVRRIGFDVFSGCEKIFRVINHVSYVDNWVISTHYTYPSSGEDSKTATLVDGIVGIADGALSAPTSPSNYQKIIIPKSIKHLGNAMFAGCTSDLEVYFTGTSAQWEALASECTDWNYGWSGTVVCNYVPQETFDFGGKEIRFVVPTYTNQYFSFSNSSGTVLEKAVFMRNNSTEAKLKVSLSFLSTQVESFDVVIRNCVMAEENIDFFVLNSNLTYLSTEGHFCNLATAKNDNHINLSNPWYNQSFIQAASVSGFLPFVSGDMTPSTWESTSVMLCNQNLFNSRFENESLYSMVKDGKWTVEQLKEYSQNCYADLNGNGRDVEDSYGVTFLWPYNAQALLYGFGFEAVEHDAGGDIRTNSTNLQRMTNMADLLSELTQSEDVFLNTSTPTNMIPSFANGKSLFLCSYFNSIRQVDQADSPSYYILPLPKLNEEQKDYISSTNNCSLVAIFKFTSDFGAATATLETFGAFSPQYIRPAFAESITTDSTKIEMIDLILDHVSPKFEHVYQSVDIWRDIYAWIKEDTNFATFWKEHNLSWTHQIEDLCAKLADN